MSFDIFLFKFVNGEGVEFSNSLVREIFAQYDPGPDDEGDFLSPEYPDGGHVEVSFDEGDTSGSVMFSHCAGNQAMEDIFELLKQVGGVLIWPGDGWAVASAAVIPHIEKELRDSHPKPPTVVSSAKELTDAIEQDGA